MTSGARPAAIRVHPDDSVAVAPRALAAGELVDIDGERVTLGADVPAGHKIGLRVHEVGEPVITYGFPIGVAIEGIAVGGWVHSHNLATALEGTAEYRYEPISRSRVSAPAATFDGYRRSTGAFGFAAYLQLLRHNAPAADSEGSEIRALWQDCRDGSHDALRALVTRACSRVDLWHLNLSRVPGFVEFVLSDLAEMTQVGVARALENLLQPGRTPVHALAPSSSTGT